MPIQRIGVGHRSIETNRRVRAPHARDQAATTNDTPDRITNRRMRAPHARPPRPGRSDGVAGGDRVRAEHAPYVGSPIRRVGFHPTVRP